MALIAALDELLVAVDVALAFQVQATPLFWLVAIGAVLIGSVVISDGLAALVSLIGRLARGAVPAAPSAGGRRRHESLAMPALRRCRPVGARGARAPGRSMLRPVRQG